MKDDDGYTWHLAPLVGPVIGVDGKQVTLLIDGEELPAIWSPDTVILGRVVTRTTTSRVEPMREAHGQPGSGVEPEDRGDA